MTSAITWADRLGAWKSRWGIGRMSYLVPPGLYALGTPSPASPVMVTANYKMSYDSVRHALVNTDAWLLVLETYGINVWCAAGKGTFGTSELVRRLQYCRVAEHVSHRRLTLPLLGAAGVSAFQVRQKTGFHVDFACVRSADLAEFLANGMVTSPAMRELSFTASERLVLTPIELVGGLRQLLPFIVLLVLTGATVSPATAWQLPLALVGALLCGSFLTPLLLPWLPTRFFAIKGGLLGLIMAMGADLFFAFHWPNWLRLSSILLLTAVSAFYALSFTGSTPFTSRSGVKREMRLALPVLILLVALSIVIVAMALFQQGLQP